MAPRKSARTKAPARRTPDELRDVLQAAGLRKTGPRVAVLGRLEKSSSPATHAELAEALLPHGLDRATVYRILIDLTEAGLVVRSDMGDHVWRFELVRAGAEHAVQHPHFVCMGCGDIVCLPENAVRVARFEGPLRRVDEQAVEVQIKGRCGSCARA